MTRPPLALVVALLLTLPLVTPKIRGADEIEYFAYLRSLVFDRDLDFENEYAHFYARDPAGAGRLQGDVPRPARGRHRAGPSTSRRWARRSCGRPFYLLAHVGVSWSRGRWARRWPPTASPGPTWPRPATPRAVYGLPRPAPAPRRAARASAASRSRRPTLGHGRRRSGARPLLYYMTLAPGFSHAVSLFAVSLLLWLTLRYARATDAPLGRGALVGAAGGLAALVREQDALFLAVPRASSWPSTRRRERRVRGRDDAAGAMGAAAVLVFVPQLLAYRAINGGFGPSHLVARKMSCVEPALLRGALRPRPRPLRLDARSCSLAGARPGRGRGLRRRDAVAARCWPLGLLLQVWINGVGRELDAGGRLRVAALRGGDAALRLGPGRAAGAASLPRWDRRAVAAAPASLFVVVERVADGAVRPQAHGPAAARMAAGGGQPGHARCRARLGRAALALLHRPRASGAGGRDDLARRSSRRVACPVCLEPAGCAACARPGGHDATCGPYAARAACACGGPDKVRLAPRRRGPALPVLRRALSRARRRGLRGSRPAHVAWARSRSTPTTSSTSASHVTDAPPVLSARVKADMMRRMLRPAARARRVLDLGCGAGKIALYAAPERRAARPASTWRPSSCRARRARWTSCSATCGACRSARAPSRAPIRSTCSSTSTSRACARCCCEARRTLGPARPALRLHARHGVVAAGLVPARGEPAGAAARPGAA